MRAVGPGKTSFCPPWRPKLHRLVAKTGALLEAAIIRRAIRGSEEQDLKGHYTTQGKWVEAKVVRAGVKGFTSQQQQQQPQPQVSLQAQQQPAQGISKHVPDHEVIMGDEVNKQ